MLQDQIKKFRGFLTLRFFLAVPMLFTTLRGQEFGTPEEIFVEAMSLGDNSAPRAYLRTTRTIRQTSPRTASFIEGAAEFIVADGRPGFDAPPDSDADGFSDEVETEYGDDIGQPLSPNGIPWAEDPDSQPPRTAYPPDVFYIRLGATNAVAAVTPGAPATQIRYLASPGVRMVAAPPCDLSLPVIFDDYSAVTSVVDENLEGDGSALYAYSAYHWGKRYFGRVGGAQLEREIVNLAPYYIEFPFYSNPSLKETVGISHQLVPNGALAIGSQQPSWLVRGAVSSPNGTPENEVDVTWKNGRLYFDPEWFTEFTWDDLVGKGLANAAADQLSLRIDAVSAKVDSDSDGYSDLMEDAYELWLGVPSADGTPWSQNPQAQPSGDYLADVPPGTVDTDGDGFSDALEDVFQVQVDGLSPNDLDWKLDPAAQPAGAFVVDVEPEKVWPAVEQVAVLPTFRSSFEFTARGLGLWIDEDKFEAAKAGQDPAITALGVSAGMLPPGDELFRASELVVNYGRNARNTINSGDVSSVQLRVPTAMYATYETWRSFRFVGAAALIDQISGPAADPDNDQIPNRVEYELGSDPNRSDSDGNGVSDTFEDFQDTDGDGIQDWLEVILGFDPDLIDSDGNGLPDPLEDRDLDGLYDYVEYRGVPQNPGDDPADPATVLFRTDLENADSDGDGLQDGFEIYVTLTNPSGADGDGDELNDLEELQAGSDPDIADSDGDELLDGEEIKLFGTDPTNDDTDGDGILDIDEDHDRDLLTTRLEREITANTGITYDPLSEDSDGDGITDDAEDADGDGLNNLLETLLFPTYFVYLADSDGNGTSDFDEDFDGDGLSNGDELFVFGTDPTRSDTLGDGTPDGDRDPDGDGLGILAEITLTLTDPLNPDTDGDSVPDGSEDPDGDLLINSDEVNVWGSNPRSSDTDLDGISDGVEVFVTLTTPTLRDTNGNGTSDYFEDSDGDFLPDGYEVGIYSGTLVALISEGQSAFAGPDADGDGLLDIHELLLTGTDYGNPDTNGNGILDGAEDPDGDGLTNAQELPPFGQITSGTELYLGGTNPQIADTDGDGLDDGVEVNVTFTNPLDIDTDDDGFRDGTEVDAGRDPSDPADFPIEQLITRPRVRSFPVVPGTPPFSNGFTVEVERLAASTPVGGVGYLYTFQGSVNLMTWSDLPSADWSFINTGPGATGDPTATYVGTGQLPSVQFFRVMATPVSITQP